ncbi:MAG: hypothetical protein J0H14_16735 [Alphaproteobacteria bacterium]|nr:hypothetical protein [Alphaproteobacteria bacterium]
MTVARENPSASRGARAWAWFAEEVRHVLPPTIFFIVGFNVVAFSINLVLAQYFIHIAGFVVATVAALVVGKAVLVADKMPFLRRFDTAPMIRPILFKTFVYWAFVFIARLIEAWVHYAMDTGRLFGFAAFTAQEFSWHKFLFIQLWVLVLFLIYTTASELNAAFGDGELFRVLFTRRSSALKLNRRQRIRALVRIGRLAETTPAAELWRPGSGANRELAALVSALGRTETASR